MKRYEDNDYPTGLMFFSVGCIMVVLCVAGLVVAKWGDAIGFGISVEESPYAEWTENGCLIGGTLFVFFAWSLYDRPRLVVDSIGNVWVRNGGCGVARFQWSDVVRWRVDVTQMWLDEGVDESRTIVVDLSANRLLRIHDCHQRFVRAFREYVPNRETAEPVSDTCCRRTNW